MEPVVALLRGVNIGKRRLSMTTLRDGLEAAGCTDVITYVQSGNVVLNPPAAQPEPLGPWLEQTIGAIAGFDVPVVLRTGAELARVVSANPYPGAGGTTLHVVFYSAPPTTVVDEVDVDSFAPERCTLIGDTVYLYLPNGMGRAKLPVALERAARRKPVIGTARNWNTVLELLRLSQTC